ncbi:gamma-glutamylcyclotransferase, partial [Francisella tularensis subsp. holarctica]|nr:gamma-glutamylcyclotransferase [Francisella tularensis subsp. holarctica]
IILEQSKLSKTPEDCLYCLTEVNPNKDNYVIGYGSIMNKDSRQITVPNATYAAQILVSSFERLWASRGEKSRATLLLA